MRERTGGRVLLAGTGSFLVLFGVVAVVAFPDARGVRLDVPAWWVGTAVIAIGVGMLGAAVLDR